MSLHLTKVSYDLRAASDATGASVSSIQEAVNTGDLVPNYLGRKPLFRAVELDAWIEAMPNVRPSTKAA